MLYDTTADVIRKALRGLGLAPSEAAARSGLAEREVIAASRGPATHDTLIQLAPSLGLDAQALAGLPEYNPPSTPLPEVHRVEVPFDDETVNAWLVQAGPDEFLLFDTGTRTPYVRQALDERDIQKVHVLITHQHGDHIDGLETLHGRTISVTIPSENAKPGDVIQIGELTVSVVDLPGHCQDAVGYVVEGLDRPVCVTGDALFAGSIGGCAPGMPYLAALDSLRAHVLTLPDDTVLLPGHGPETSVGSERKRNPFLATESH